jgi:hypothetical protein
MHPSTSRPRIQTSARKIVLLALSALVGVFALSGATALGAAPETPEALPAGPVGATTATLHGVLNPKQPGEAGAYYEFRYEPSTSECEHGNEAGYGGAGYASGAMGEVVERTATELLAGTNYTFCLRITNEAGESALSSPQTFTTSTVAAAVSEPAVLMAGATEATLTAKVDPGGVPTVFYVEYGPTATYGSITAPVSAGAGGGPVPVQLRLAGLQAGSEYHFRFVSSNELGSDQTEDLMFTTAESLGAASSALPDGRVYELVSSAMNNQTVASPVGNDHGVAEGTPSEDENSDQPFQAASNGDALAYSGQPDLEGGSGNFGAGKEDEWLATRGPEGWSSADIRPAAAGGAEFYLFSTDLSVGLLFGGPENVHASPAPPLTCETNIYSRTADGQYHSLVSHLPPSTSCGGPSRFDISPDDSHLLFADPAALTEGAAEGQEAARNIYDSVDGRLSQVNILPDGKSQQEPDAWLGSSPAGGNAPADFSNAVSADGSRIFWSSAEEAGGSFATTALYVRENDTQPQSPLNGSGECASSADACTLQIDTGEPRCVAEGACAGGGGVFQTASSDGSRVLFTDERKLTSDSTAAPGEPDLYEYEMSSEAGKAGTIVDLTRPAGGHADVLGVVSTSEDASYIYLVADGVLTSEPNAQGDDAVAGQPNLYLMHDGDATFVTTLAKQDNELAHLYGEAVGDWSHAPSNRTAKATPDGQTLVFESHQRLTGYDNQVGRETFQNEVYVYDAATRRITCASCNPSGVKPSEPFEATVSLLPVAGNGSYSMQEYAPRWLSDSGDRVFFDTSQSLLPQDTNGRRDVYEWERNGAGSCQPASSPAAERGCLYLISGGQSGDDSSFVDADTEGDNVFFTSRGQLIPQAGDQNMAMYDARVGGGFPELTTTCVGTGCQGIPPAPPIFATPASVTYDGVGNFEAQTKATNVKPKKKKPVKCKRRFVSKHGKCVRKQSKKLKRSGRRSENGRKR